VSEFSVRQSEATRAGLAILIYTKVTFFPEHAPAGLPSSVGSRRQLPPREALVVVFIFAMSIILLLGIAKT